MDGEQPPAPARPPAGTGPAYAFDNAWAAARERLAALEAVFDPGTVRHLTARGVRAGWHCLEVGAGGGSIAGWLCERVGPAGRVVATDLDPRFVAQLPHANLEVWRHDLRTDPLPAAAFDLVHARLVLEHLPAPGAALARLVRALRPGGWLVVEDFDFVSAVPDPAVGPAAAAAFRKVMHAPRAQDVHYGRRLTGDLLAQPLEDVDAEGRVFVWRGGTAGARAWRLSFEQLGPALVRQGHVTAAELDRVLALLEAPHFRALSQLLMTAWGRRAAAA